MNISIKCAWIKRWKKEKTENVKDYPMCFVLGEDNILLDCLDRGKVERTRLRLLIDIMDCWQKFKNYFYRKGKNREEMLLFGNRMLDEMQETLEVRIFGRVR